MCLIAVAIYAGVFHDHRHDDGIYGNIGGGFGLMILSTAGCFLSFSLESSSLHSTPLIVHTSSILREPDCILAIFIIAVLIWKKGEITAAEESDHAIQKTHQDSLSVEGNPHSMESIAVTAH
jgi:hypothetical protein